MLDSAQFLQCLRLDNTILLVFLKESLKFLCATDPNVRCRNGYDALPDHKNLKL